MDPRFEHCWFLTGATASGKSQVGLELALRSDAEIISLDSMAVYRQMDIGTAKPTAEQIEQVPHHLIDIVDPNQAFSVADYIERAAACVKEIEAKGKRPLFVGGTPLYLKALLRGMFEGPPADWEFRQEIEREIEEVGLDALHARLKQVDPLSAEKLPRADVRRIVRALEVYKITGKPISHLQMQFEEGRAAEECNVFVLDWARPVLHSRISDRVEAMFDRGLIDEVKQLLAEYQSLSRTALQAVGYREVIDFLGHSLGTVAMDLPEGVGPEGVASEGVASDDVASDDVASDDVASGDVASGDGGDSVVSLPVSGPADPGEADAALDAVENQDKLNRTIEKVKTRTRRFAKRQGTWFRSLSECQTVARSESDTVEGVALEILRRASETTA